MINDDLFLQVISSTPLISIDLIIENSAGEILLGKRLNRPAQGFWFVPGGRINKNELIADAFARISETEIGTALSINDAQLLGAYNHIYDDNYLGKEGINTHYVVLAYKIKLNKSLSIQTDEQHSELKWHSISEILDSQQIHPNTQAYFN